MLLVLVLLLGVASAQNQFFNPPKGVDSQNYSVNGVWTIGSIQNIQWTTTLSNYTITLWQQVLGQYNAHPGPSIFETQQGAVTEFIWTVQNFQFDLDTSNVFFLWLEASNATLGNKGGVSFISHYFNMSAYSASSSAVGQPSSTSATFSTSISSTTIPYVTSNTQTSATSSSSATNTPIPTGSSGLSHAEKVGLGLGLGLGFSIGALIIICVLIRRQRKAAEQERRLEAGAEPPYEGELQRHPHLIEPSPPNGIAKELRSDREAVELSA